MWWWIFFKKRMKAYIVCLIGVCVNVCTRCVTKRGSVCMCALAFRSVHIFRSVCRTAFRWVNAEWFLIAIVASPFWSSAKRPCSLAHGAKGKAIPHAQAHMGCTCMPSNQLDLNNIGKRYNWIYVSKLMFQSMDSNLLSAGISTEILFSSQFTKWHCDVVAHSEQLPEADDLIFRRNANLFHLFDGKSNGVLVMWCHHDADFLCIFTFVFQNLAK